LYHLSDLNGQYDVEPVSPAGTFLADATFQRDFEELYAYYKDARLLQLAVRDGRLAGGLPDRGAQQRHARVPLGDPAVSDVFGCTTCPT
ncbi:hypothetical protein CTI14_54315, partial [Methylobacterium radiotolerans]